MHTHKDEGCLEPFRTSVSLGLAQVSDLVNSLWGRLVTGRVLFLNPSL